MNAERLEIIRAVASKRQNAPAMPKSVKAKPPVMAKPPIPCVVCKTMFVPKQSRQNMCGQKCWAERERVMSRLRRGTWPLDRRRRAASPSNASAGPEQP
jgi:hypothetical protein